MLALEQIHALYRYLATLPELVLPITYPKEGSSRVTPSGTAILAHANGRFFVISAAHVLAAEAVSPLIHGKNGATEVGEVVVVTEGPKPLGLDVDLAYSEVDRAEVERIGAEGAIELAALNLDALGKVGDSYVAIGYPASKSKVRVGARVLSNSLTHLIADSESAERYEELGVTPRTHLVLKYDRRAMASVGGPMTMGVHPKGMSGGIVLGPFRRADAAAGLVAGAVGILIEYRERSASLLIASHFRFVTESMRLRYPELRTYLPMSSHAADTHTLP